MQKILVKSILVLLHIIHTIGFLSAFDPQNSPKIIPHSILFGNPEIEKVTISPDGKRIAYLAPDGDAMNIWVQNLDGSSKRCITHEKRSLESYFWGYDNKTIFYYNDNGNENTNIYRVDLATGKICNLTPFSNGVQVRLIGYSPKHPHSMLIGMNKERADLFDVYLLNTEDAQLQLVEKNPGYIAGFDIEPAWHADNDLTIRIACRFNEGGGTEVLYRADQAAPWEHLLTWDVNASASSCVIGFSATNDEVYLSDASESNTAQLVTMNLTTRKKKFLIHDKYFDIITGSSAIFYDKHPAFLINPITKAPAAFFLPRDLPTTVILNESLQADFEELERHKLGYMYVSSTDMSFQKWIIECVNDDRPVEYYVYDRSYKSLQLIALSNPHILAYQRAHTESIVFTARDGLKIHGYLTLPTAPSSRSHLPLVLLVHGGPWIRDCWGFDPRVQFFANRGYACLQINYRGSSGFGTAFVKASNKEYGRAMQHDLIDGAQWLIDQEIVDMHKIAICGRSFGGYAALAGATFTPDFYRCAISLYGKGNLINTKESVPPYWIPGLVVWKYRKGDPIIEEAMLKEQSPLFHLDNVHIPLLIAHGAHDARIKHTESEKIVELLRKRNIPCEYILFHNEGHGLNSTQSKCTFWGAVELFLAEHLGGRSETMI